MGVLNTEIIDNLNEQIEGVINFANNLTEIANEEIKAAQDEAQQIVNEKVDQLSAKITQKGNEIRNKAVEIFSSQYQTALEKIAPIEPILSMFPISISLDVECLTAIYEALVAIKDVIVAPYQPIIEFTTEVVPKVLQLSANIQTLVSYQPALNVPDGVTIPPLNIDIDPITAGDITGGAS